MQKHPEPKRRIYVSTVPLPPASNVIVFEKKLWRSYPLKHFEPEDTAIISYYNKDGDEWLNEKEYMSIKRDCVMSGTLTESRSIITRESLADLAEKIGNTPQQLITSYYRLYGIAISDYLRSHLMPNKHPNPSGVLSIENHIRRINVNNMKAFLHSYPRKRFLLGEIYDSTTLPRSLIAYIIEQAVIVSRNNGRDVGSEYELFKQAVEQVNDGDIVLHGNLILFEASLM